MLGKRLINTTVAGAAPSCSTDTLQVLGDTSCVAYYKMSDATDESGSYDGTPTDVNFNVAGKFGNAGSFNGSSSVIDLGSPLLGQTHSVSLWFNADSIATDTEGDILFAQYTDGVTGRYIISIYTNTMRIFVGGSPIQTISATWTANAWTHFVIVKNSSGYEAFVNGSSIGTSSLTSNIDTASNTTIGAGRFTSPFKVFPGKIDQVRIFNKALSSTEVTTLYNEVQCVPTIVPTDYFNTVLYDGTGGTKSITGVGFKPDLVWIKSRNSTDYNVLFDSVRGNNFLSSNTTSAEDTTNVVTLASYDSNGFTTGNDNGTINGNGDSLVAWNWKAGGAPTATNSAGAGNVPTAGSVKIDGVDSTTALAGTIAATSISANTDSGFSIVKYTGTLNSAGNVSVAHGLSQAVELIISKRFDSTGFWRIRPFFLNNNPYDYLEFDAGALAQFSASDGVMALPTSTTFDNNWNSALGGAGDVINYCFHSVDGYSKIGSYVGNGSTNGTMVVTGFRPAFVMIKNTDGGDTWDRWYMSDNKRLTDGYVYANESLAEQPYQAIDMLSNGFQLITTDTGVNQSGDTYIYMAFAEEVFVPDNFFNDDSTLATYKLDGDAGDDSGNGYNGTASNVTYATGKFDEAAVFNGSSSGVNTPLPFLNAKATSSVSLWVKYTDTTSYKTLFQDWSSNNNWNHNIVANQPSTGNLRFFSAYGGSGGYKVFETSGLTLNDGNWHHIVSTVDLSTNTLTGYVDGVSVGNVTVSTNSWTGVTQNANIGNENGASNFFNGSIDQVRIFDRALSSAEVTQLYNE